MSTISRELAATLGWDRVGAYHAGLTKEEQREIEEWFIHAGDAVLVATTAYGMAVDKADIRATCVGACSPCSMKHQRTSQQRSPAAAKLIREELERPGFLLIPDLVRKVEKAVITLIVADELNLHARRTHGFGVSL